MLNLKIWAVVSCGALTALVTLGCGNATELGDKANQDGEAALADDQTSGDNGSTAGGSLALTSPDEADAAVAKIQVRVLTSLDCLERRGPHGHKEGHDRRPPPPPRKGGHGKGKGGMPPPPPPPRDDLPMTEGEADQGDRRGPPHKCLVAETTEDFATGQALQLDGIPVGSYYVVVVLGDADGKALQEGSAQVEIKAGEVAAAEITLQPVQAGSVAVTIKQAEEEGATSPAGEAAAEAAVEADDTTDAETESTEAT